MSFSFCYPTSSNTYIGFVLIFIPMLLVVLKLDRVSPFLKCLLLYRS